MKDGGAVVGGGESRIGYEEAFVVEREQRRERVASGSLAGAVARSPVLAGSLLIPTGTRG